MSFIVRSQTGARPLAEELAQVPRVSAAEFKVLTGNQEYTTIDSRPVSGTHTHTYTHRYMYTCTCTTHPTHSLIHTHANTPDACTHLHIHTCMHTHTHACMHTHTYTHTHTNTHTHSPPISAPVIFQAL